MLYDSEYHEIQRGKEYQLQNIRAMLDTTGMLNIAMLKEARRL